MIWKILTFAYLVMFITWGIIYSEKSDILTFEILKGSIIGTFLAMSVLGICISLGWKKQLFTKKIFIFILMSWLALIVYDCINIFQLSYNESIIFYQDKILALTNTICNIFAGLFQINIYYIPFFIGLFQYKKNIETFPKVDKPIWKIFAIVSVNTLIIPFFIFFQNYNDIIKYTVFDYIVIFSWIYEIAFLVGFSFNLQILNKLFWKITAIPYIIIQILGYFLCSETYNQNFYYKTTSIPLIISEVILSAIYLYALIKYAYKKENLELEKQI